MIKVLLILSVLLNIASFGYQGNSAVSHLKNEVKLTKNEREFLDKIPYIRIYMDYSYPPYSFIENNKLQGFSVEYADLLSKLLGVRFEYITDITWSKALEKLKDKDIDAIGQIVNTKQRQKFALFTQDYYNYYTGVITKKENNHFTSLESLKDKTVGLVKGYYEENLLKEHYPSIKIKTYKDNNKLLEALLDDEFDATVQTYQVLQYLINKKNLTNKLINIPLKIEPILGITREAFGVRKDWTLFRSALDKVIILTQIDRNKLEQKWLGVKEDEQSDKIYLNSKETEYLDSKEFITMCVDPDWEPYEQIDEKGNHIGLASNFISLIEKKIDKEIKLIPTINWEQSLEFVRDGKCEIISFLNQTTKRDKYLNFTPTLYKEAEVIISKSDITYINGLHELEGKTIAIVKGYKTDEMIQKNHPDIKLKYINNYEEGFQLVSDGKVYASINSLMGTAYLIRKNNLFNIKIAGETKNYNRYRIGINKNDYTLHSIFSKAVNSITEKEKTNALSNWISIKFEKKVDYSLLWQISIFFLLIVIFLFYREFVIKRINKKLKKEMKKQLEQIIEKDRMIFQQNKLASMGEMIENIAHQWRQPLSQVNAAVMTIDDIVYDSGCLNKQMKKELDDIEKATQYMSKTIDDFRRFISSSNSDEYFNIVNVVKQCLSIISKPLEYSFINVQINIDENLKIKGSSSEFLQVIMVIFNNSKEAILSNDMKKGKIEVKGYKNKEKMILSICDNGGGIKDNIEEKIFEPYFTTKHKSKGTGLGLYISKMIIEGKFKGKLWMENQNNGACIFMEFNIPKEKS